MTYDFTTLSPDDFENLIADLLSKEWGARLETFKSGKDSGIDLRNSRVVAGTPTTIVQCKRYAPHKFAELDRNIRKEKKKLDKLQPRKYVLVTSVALSPANKDTLVRSLEPWCVSPADIYGASEVNALLRDHSEIERVHFKLWISSTTVLERILHSRIFNITQATIESTKAYLSRIVMHEGFNRALEILQREHHVVIVGNPGIGKTTLARILLCHYMREQFEPLCVVSNIEDAWDLVHGPSSTNRRMVVFYDDFLGRLRFDEERFGKNEELSLLAFLDHVRRSPNLRLILTTREYILADAQRIHGAFDAHVTEFLKCTLSLEDYSKSQRAKMLFNHLYFSDLPDSRLERLVQTMVYNHIVEHRHFNPRVVETVSKYANSRALSDEEYVEFVRQEFANPAKVWEHPFRYDISPLGRQILAVLWTFGGAAELERLKSAVMQLVTADDRANVAMLLTDGLRQLNGNFVMTNRFPEDWEDGDELIIVQFQNPSVEEFVESVLASEAIWIQELIQGIVCLDQVQALLVLAGRTGSSKKMDSSFWTRLRKVAAACEGSPGGSLVNYRSPFHGEFMKVWREKRLEKAESTHLLLRIESKVKLHDVHFRHIQSRVLTVAGWTDIMSGISRDVFTAYWLSRVHNWVVEESGWSAATRAQSSVTLRQAIVEFVSDEEEVCSCDVSTLRTLAKMISNEEAAMSDAEKNAFAAAARIIVSTIEDNPDECDDAEGQAGALAMLEDICSISLTPQKNILTRIAERQREKDVNSRHDDISYRVPSKEDDHLDIDALFRGLLDR